MSLLRNGYRIISDALTEREIPNFVETLSLHHPPHDWRQRAGDHDIYGAKPRLLYALTRAIQPRYVVETGVMHGRSSRAILAALYDNDVFNGITEARLTSIDRPTVGTEGRYNGEGRWDNAHVLNVADTGREVPDYLRSRWDLMLGYSDVLLPDIARNNLNVDLFYHDSEHTYGTMHAEYTTIWPALQKYGILLSDDVDWNDALFDFAQEQGRTACAIQVNPDGGLVGGIMK